MDLSHVDFTNANLEGCSYNYTTKLPPGFDPATRGMVDDSSDINIEGYEGSPAMR